MKNLDRTAFFIIIIAGLLLFGVIFMGNQAPIYVVCQLPDQCTQVGPYGPVIFAFSRPVQSDRIESLWQTTPKIKGKWDWLDNQHARWTSINPLPLNQEMTFQFASGQAGQNGEQISNNYHWEVTVRSPQVLVPKNSGSGLELYAFGMENGASEVQLTHTNDKMTDYTVSPDGESIVFSAMNDRYGIDLWMVQRDGSNQYKLLDCGIDWCVTPTWSPIAKELAYSRESGGLDPNGQKGASRIWIFDIQTGQTSALFADPQQVGDGPNYSPDGQWLSYWETGKGGTGEGGIQVLNRKTGITFFLESSTGDVGCWTADSRYFYYSDMNPGEVNSQNVVLRVDVSNQSISKIFGGNGKDGGLNVSNPVCDPKEKWVAVSIRPDLQNPGKELWLLDPQSQDSITITSDFSRVPDYYAWSADGNYLVFQSDGLENKEGDEEIWVWNRDTEKAQKITVGGKLPQWLP